DAFVYSREPWVMRIATLQRFILEGAIPFAVVTLLFRDDPRRYGLRLGDWRAGLALAGVGTAVLLPVVIWAGHQPAFGAYSPPGGPVRRHARCAGADLTTVSQPGRHLRAAHARHFQPVDSARICPQ